MTYSIVARDPATGQLGIAAHSHVLGVGRILHHVRPGVGAVATQAAALYIHGDRILDALAAGADPATALAGSLARDDDAATRQVTVIDRHGATAAHTGAECIRFAGHHEGTDGVVAGNILAGPDVLDAMVAAVSTDPADAPDGDAPDGDAPDGDAPSREATDGEALARRMLAALRAAEDAGGDQRGSQSATMIVVNPVATDDPLQDRVVDVRVDDHPEPIGELARLVDLALVHHAVELAEQALLDGDHDAAVSRYLAALDRLGDNHEFHVWAAAALVGADQHGTAEHLVAALHAAPDRARWEEFSRRLAECGMVPPEVVDTWW